MKVGDLVKSTRFNNSLGIIVKEDRGPHQKAREASISMYYVYWQRSGKIDLAWVGGLEVVSEGR